MSTPLKRTYHSKAREEQSKKTTKRILDAAKRLFQSNGFGNTTIEEIAQKAEVSVPSIYAIFKSKRGILLALMDAALPTEKREALVEQAMQENSPDKSLANTAHLTRTLYDAEKKHNSFFQGASILDPAFKELEHEREKRRYERQEEFVKMIAEKKMFNKNLSISKVRDILWAFTGRDLYRMLVIERGWSSDDYEKWLAHTLIQTLL